MISISHASLKEMAPVTSGLFFVLGFFESTSRSTILSIVIPATLMKNRAKNIKTRTLTLGILIVTTNAPE